MLQLLGHQAPGQQPSHQGPTVDPHRPHLQAGPASFLSYSEPGSLPNTPRTLARDIFPGTPRLCYGFPSCPDSIYHRRLEFAETAAGRPCRQFRSIPLQQLPHSTPESLIFVGVSRRRRSSLTVTGAPPQRSHARD